MLHDANSFNGPLILSLLWRSMLAARLARCAPSMSGPPHNQFSTIKMGLIVHAGLDGGDTAQREGWYWFGVWIRKHVLNDPWTVPRKLTFAEVMRLLEPKADGVFYRHPKLSPWNNPYSKEYGFSIVPPASLYVTYVRNVRSIGPWRSGGYGSHDSHTTSVINVSRSITELLRSSLSSSRHVYSHSGKNICSSRSARTDSPV
jgi:hypothetical protein